MLKSVYGWMRRNFAGPDSLQADSLRRVLRQPLVLTASPFPRVPRPHRRADNPALTIRQLAGAIRMAQQWGDKVIALRKERHYWRRMQPGTAYGGQYVSWMRLNKAMAEKEFRTLLIAQTRDWENKRILDDEQIAEITELARNWVQWRKRGAEPHRYGACTELIHQAHWYLLEHLLHLEMRVE